MCLQKLTPVRTARRFRRATRCGARWRATFLTVWRVSPYYSGKIYKRKYFSVAQVKSSNGQSEVRYRTHFTVTIAEEKIKGLFNLSNRSHNRYKILIGRRTISRKF